MCESEISDKPDNQLRSWMGLRFNKLTRIIVKVLEANQFFHNSQIKYKPFTKSMGKLRIIQYNLIEMGPA